MKTIVWKKKEVLHIEIPNGIINIQCGLTDRFGRNVDSIKIIGDGTRYAGDYKTITVPKVCNVRIIRLKTVKN